MAALIASVVGSLVLAASLYDAARLIGPVESRLPPLARLRGRRAALEDAERWCVGLLLHSRIDGPTYQERMSVLARLRRPVGR